MLSVILCTHDPRPEYLRRVLEGLKRQTLPQEQWELVVIDNQSREPLTGRLDVSWRAGSKIIREETLGLTAARLRGIAESSGEILVFVDDDNILDANYLQVAGQLSLEWPKLGAWGGNIDPEFEVSPPDWTREYWGYLAILSVSEEIWSNDLQHAASLPCGAGLCVRRGVAERYRQETTTKPWKVLMDRKGADLVSGGDTDLVHTVGDFGMGFGFFPQLHLLHLIPVCRLEEDYLVNLVEGITTSQAFLQAIRNHVKVNLRSAVWEKLGYFAQWIRLDRRRRRFLGARSRGLRRAHALVQAVERRAPERLPLAENPADTIAVKTSKGL